MAASTTIITDLAGLAAPTAASTANAIAASGQIIDLVGMQKQALEAAKELKTLLTALKTAYDASDPNLTTINNDLSSLS